MTNNVIFANSMKMKMRFYIYLLYFAAVIVVAFSSASCKKPLSFATGNLSFSADTVIFDTVFTTIGSTTKRLKIYNNDSKTLKIESVELEGGANSPFRINVDGASGTLFGDLEIEGNDSMFVFVEVTLDPNNALTPMIVEDRIRFRTNGTDQYVELVAWGQDAYFHVSTFGPNGSLDKNEGTWPNDKPHVIYGGAFVDSAKILDILPGTQIYLHKNAYLFNYKGTLNINGTLNNPVTIQGDRLESYYDDVSGQYYGVYFREARPSKIDYAIIKNATTGIHIEGTDAASTGNTLELTNTIIQNCASYGILLFQGAKLKAENSIVSHSGIHALVVIGGAEFNVNHCDLLGYGTGQNVGPAVGISNYYNNPNSASTEVSDLNCTITNSAIYGLQDYELALDTIAFGGVSLNFVFDNNLIRSEEIFTDNFFTDNLWNQEPYFYNPTEYDFHIYGISPMNGAGDASYPTMFNTDIENKPRTGPDIGAYEVN